MTMFPSPPMAHLTSEQIAAIHAEQKCRIARLAAEWHAEGIGRAGPTIHHRHGFRIARPGKWYLVVAGRRIRATATQARKLNAIGVSVPQSISVVMAQE